MGHDLVELCYVTANKILVINFIFRKKNANHVRPLHFISKIIPPVKRCRPHLLPS